VPEANNYRNVLPAALTGLVLLGMFILWNDCQGRRDLRKKKETLRVVDREQLPDTSGYRSKQWVFYDFEWGNPADTTLHLTLTGHNSRQSFCLKPWMPFSPGLWVQFKDLPGGDSCWIRVSGSVWAPPGSDSLPCDLVVTCNHNNLNLKYVSFPVEEANLQRGAWNRITLDYRIPDPPDKEDVLKAYFWYRGDGEMLVDNIRAVLFEKVASPTRDIKPDH